MHRRVIALVVLALTFSTIGGALPVPAAASTVVVEIEDPFANLSYAEKWDNLFAAMYAYAEAHGEHISFYDPFARFPTDLQDRFKQLLDKDKLYVGLSRSVTNERVRVIASDTYESGYFRTNWLVIDEGSPESKIWYFWGQSYGGEADNVAEEGPAIVKPGGRPVVQFYDRYAEAWVDAPSEIEFSGGGGQYPRLTLSRPEGIWVRVIGNCFATISPRPGEFSEVDAPVNVFGREFFIEPSSIRWELHPSPFLYLHPEEGQGVNGLQYLIPITYVPSEKVAYVYGLFDGFKQYGSGGDFFGYIPNFKSGDTARLEVWDSGGNLVKTVDLVVDSSGMFEFSLLGLSKGEYDIRIFHNGEVVGSSKGWFGYGEAEGGPPDDLAGKIVYYLSLPFVYLGQLLSSIAQGVSVLISPTTGLLSVVSGMFSWLPKEIQDVLMISLTIGCVVAVIRMFRR